MRRLKRISFFLYSCLLFAVGFYGHYKIEQWFYPGRQTIISQNEIPFFQMQSATQAVSVPDRLRADTKLVVKNTDQVSRRQTEEIKSLPLRLIGCSRKEVEDEIRHYQDAPPLTEDSRVLYLQTAIDARTLPSEVRRQILNGWHGVSKAELEKFLVSQTET